MNKLSKRPCPICEELVIIIGKDKKNYSIGSCGCRFKFKKTKSQKLMDRQYKEMPWGLEIIKN